MLANVNTSIHAVPTDKINELHDYVPHQLQVKVLVPYYLDIRPTSTMSPPSPLFCAQSLT